MLALRAVDSALLCLAPELPLPPCRIAVVASTIATRSVPIVGLGVVVVAVAVVMVVVRILIVARTCPVVEVEVVLAALLAEASGNAAATEDRADLATATPTVPSIAFDEADSEADRMETGR